MTPSRFRLLSPRSRLLSTFGICAVVCASTACTPVTADRAAHSVEQKAAAKAEEAYRSYIDASNEIDSTNPDTFGPVAEFTTPQFYAGVSASWIERHASGEVVGGRMVLDSFQATMVYPDQRVDATACLDMTRVTLIDRHGESLLPKDPPDFLEMNLMFISVDDEALLDDQLVVPLSSCAATRSAPTPGMATPHVADTSAPGNAPGDEMKDASRGPTARPFAKGEQCADRH